MADRGGDRLRSGTVRVGEDGPAWTEDVVIQGVVEAGHLPAVEGDHVAVRAWHALDESVQAQAAQVVGHGPREYASSCRPSRAATNGRRSRFWKPSGTTEKWLMACSSACTRTSPKRSAETRRLPRTMGCWSRSKREGFRLQAWLRRSASSRRLC